MWRRVGHQRYGLREYRVVGWRDSEYNANGHHTVGKRRNEHSLARDNRNVADSAERHLAEYDLRLRDVRHGRYRIGQPSFERWNDSGNYDFQRAHLQHIGN